MTIDDVLAMSDDEAITSAILFEAEFSVSHTVDNHRSYWRVRHPSWRGWDSLFTSQGSAARSYIIGKLNLER